MAATSTVYFGTDLISSVGMSTGYSADGGGATLRVKCEIDLANNKLFRAEVERLVEEVLKPSGIQEARVPRTVGVRLYVNSVEAEVIIAGRSYGDMACSSVAVVEETASGWGTIEIEFRGSI